MSSFNSTKINCKYDIYISPTDLVSLLLSLNRTGKGEGALKLMFFNAPFYNVYLAINFVF